MSQHFTEAWRAVATAKVAEFGYQCERLAGLAHDGDVNVSEAASTLREIAEAHSLGVIIDIIADAFVPPAVMSEAAE